MRKSAAAASAAIHTLVFLTLLLLSVAPMPNPAPSPETAKPVTKLVAPQRPHGGGGGGESSRLPPKLGKAPPAATTRIFIPPMIQRVEQPKLPVVVALLDAPPVVATSDWGSPTGVEGMKTAGQGDPTGIGTRGRGGVGDEDGPRFGGVRLRLPRNASPPVPVYTPEPEYAEEARKARFQGTVILAIEVGPDGAARKIRVVEGLGMGLDEKAVEAVARWRFRPAEAAGKPIPAPALVEVTFRLL